MQEPDAFQRHEIQKKIGTAMLWLGGMVAVLILIDHAGVGALSMPAFWYRSRSLHLLICVGFLGTGFFLLRRPSGLSGDGTTAPADRWPVFEVVRFYSRSNCPLCDEAMDVLEEYGDWMPEIEFIDISEDSELEEQYGECIPVIEMDGRVRFRGHVDRVLLQRLIAAQQDPSSAPDQESLI